MVFFWKKNENILTTIERYFDQCDLCFNLVDKAFAIYLDMGLGASFNAAVDEAHGAESTADDMRREIEYTLYGKALLPESRGDILGLLETYDNIPNVAESILFAIKCQHVRLPDGLKSRFRKLLDLNLEAYFLTRKSINHLFHNPAAALHSAKEVDDKESASDRFEREIISDIFLDPDLDMGTRLLLRDLVLLIGTISDRAETTADRISIIAIKRKI